MKITPVPRTPRLPRNDKLAILRAVSAVILAASPFCATTAIMGATNTFTGATANMTTTTNWSLGANPFSSTSAGSYADVLFTGTSNLSLTTSSGTSTNMASQSYNVTNGSSYTLQITSTSSASFRAGSTGSTAGESLTTFTNGISGVGQDMVYLSGNSNLTFNATNTGGGTAATFVLRQAGNFNISSGSTLTINPAITGNFALNINGAGTTIFNGANTNTALTTVNGGTLRFGANNVTADSAGITVAGGTLDIQSFNDSVGAVTLSSGSITGSGGTLTGSSYAINGTGSISANLAGASAALSVNNAATTLTLSGTNTYGGLTTLQNDTVLQVGSVGALSANSILKTGGSSSAANGSSINLNVAGNYAMSSLSLGGIVTTAGPASGTATLTFNGGGVMTGSSGKTLNPGVKTTIVMGSTVGGSTFDIIGSTASGDRNVTLSGDGNVVFNSILQNNASGAAAAFIGGINKTGNGTVTMNAVNTYTGSTNVAAGTLKVGSTGSINTTSGISVAGAAKLVYNGTAALTVAPNLSGAGTGSRAVLGGSGTLNAALTLNDLGDTLSPGESPGILSFTPNQTWTSFSYDWEANNFLGTIAGTDFDKISIAGALSLTGGSGSYLLNLISLTAGNASGNVGNFSNVNQTWTLLTAAGGITGFNAANWTVDPSLFTAAGLTGTFALSQSGLNNLVLTYNAIPEPGIVGMMMLGGLGLLFAGQRLRRRSA